jgi:hypothetical protein
MLWQAPPAPIRSSVPPCSSQSRPSPSGGAKTRPALTGALRAPRSTPQRRSAANHRATTALMTAHANSLEVVVGMRIRTSPPTSISTAGPLASARAAELPAPAIKSAQERHPRAGRPRSPMRQAQILPPQLPASALRSTAGVAPGPKSLLRVSSHPSFASVQTTWPAPVPEQGQSVPRAQGGPYRTVTRNPVAALRAGGRLAFALLNPRLRAEHRNETPTLIPSVAVDDLDAAVRAGQRVCRILEVLKSVACR